jgi:hypothetical protein
MNPLLMVSNADLEQDKWDLTDNCIVLTRQYQTIDRPRHHRRQFGSFIIVGFDYKLFLSILQVSNADLPSRISPTIV